MHQAGGSGRVTLRQLRAFVAVARHAGFTRAADALHLSQSAVSLLVRDLEHALDARLLERGRRLSVTEAGAEFLGAATRVLDDLELAVANTRRTRDARRRVVRLAVGHLLAATVVPEAIAAFAAERPDVDVVVLDCPVEQVAGRVAAGEADAGIGSIDADVRQSDLRVELLLRDSLHVVSAATAPPLRPDGGDGSVPWKRLDGEPLILANPANRVWHHMRARLSEQGRSVSVDREVAMLSTGLALARHGLGRLLAPGFCAGDAALRGLRVQPLVRPVVRWDVSAVRRRGAVPSPVVDALFDRVRRTVAR
jgi:LysR family carnitine catabolism transcriptional activator